MAARSDDPPSRAPPADAGLCSTCRYAEPVRSARGSAFLRCALSDADPAYPRYPRLPVLRCDGYCASVC